MDVQSTKAIFPRKQEKGKQKKARDLGRVVALFQLLSFFWISDKSTVSRPVFFFFFFFCSYQQLVHIHMDKRGDLGKIFRQFLNGVRYQKAGGEGESRGVYSQLRS